MTVKIKLHQFERVVHRALNSSELQAMGIDMLPGYKDPYSDRVLTKGQIGCFPSHSSANIWKQVQLCSDWCELNSMELQGKY